MATLPTGIKEMQTYAARYASFTTAHQLTKRRASSQTSTGSGKRKGGNTVEWPHEKPSGSDLARAGFFYSPAQDSHDNVQCFLCAVKLDGWEPTDDPITEHLAHAATCAWALSWRAGVSAREDIDASADPMSEELVAARRGTFETGSGWPHESKRGWKCKVQRMVETGWCLDPAPASAEGVGEGEEEADGVTCFYCELSLDGWEPKDDPLMEHKRRSPDCAFFALMEKLHGGEKKAAKGRGGKKGGRASTVSKASIRLSSQSALSVFSQEPSFADVGTALDMSGNVEIFGVDDSIMSTASQATATGTTKGMKKPGRPKAAAKGANGRKRTNTAESQVDFEYPDLTSQNQPQGTLDDEPQISQLDEPPAKKGRKPTRQSKQPQVDSSVVELSSLDAPPPAKKATRARKAKPQPQSLELEAETELSNSDVSQQLQEELERSMSIDVPADLDDATPQPEQVVRPKRGVKRTSEGLKKKQQQDESDVSIIAVEFPVPPKATSAPAKAKKGRVASKQITTVASVDSQVKLPSHQPDDAPTSEAEVAPPAKSAAKTKKAPAPKSKAKGRKASSARSSRSSKETVIASGFEQAEPEPEDLERDEREIEAELARMAAEQASLQTALEAEQERSAEFEPSPSNKRNDDVSRRQSAKPKVSSPPPQLPPLNLAESKNATPSPSGSDKENQPSSAFAPPTAKQFPAAAPTFLLSPTKTSRIPLAPGTPNRALLSPSKRSSPLKQQQLSRLTSALPWQPLDLDTILLASPQPSPGTMAAKFATAVGGALETPERGLTVEAWVRLRAERAEEELRGRCEELVGIFEREGGRGMGCLGSLVVE